MAPRTTVAIAIVDEGYSRKYFKFPSTTKLQKVLRSYLAFVCNECGRPELLEFGYETTKITDAHSAESLRMQDGDVIDVRITEHCTRGACPLPAGQTLPNVHYLSDTVVQRRKQEQQAQGIVEVQDAVEEQQAGPEAPERITLTLRDHNNVEMLLHVKPHTRLRKIMKAFANHTGRDISELRFMRESDKLLPGDTLTTAGLEDGELIDVRYWANGGGRGPTA